MSYLDVAMPVVLIGVLALAGCQTRHDCVVTPNDTVECNENLEDDGGNNSLSTDAAGAPESLPG